MYAIIKTGGKQYRVEQGQSLLVERLPAADGDTVALEPLLFVDGDDVVDGDDLSKVKIEARVVGHERGPKLRVVKFKPKRGYRRRTGHRQELTRLEVTSVGRAAARARKRAASPKAAADKPSGSAKAAADKPAASAKAAADKPAGSAKAAAEQAGESDGS